MIVDGGLSFIYTNVTGKFNSHIVSRHLDTVSINTVILEEMCVNETTATSFKIIDVESPDKEKNNDPKENDLDIIVQTESSNLKTPAVPEKIDTCAVSVTLDVEASESEKAAPANNDVEIKEIYREKTRLSHESAKTQASSRTNKNLLKHSADKSIEDEIETKRMRLQRQDSKRSNSNKINVPQPSTVVREDNTEPLKSLSSIPKIKKIETVHYNVTMIPKPVRQPSVAASSIFSPPNYGYCESNISSIFDQDFAKGCISLRLIVSHLC